MSPEEFESLPAASAFAGRTPPHSIEAEEYLISCCLLDGGSTVSDCILARLPGEAFYIPANRVIYDHLCDLHRDGLPAAIEILIEVLRAEHQLEAIGGVPYIMQVSARIPTTAQASFFISKVRELWLLREAIKFGTGFVEKAFQNTGEFKDWWSDATQDLTSLSDKVAGVSSRSWPTIVDEAKARTIQAIKDPENAEMNGFYSFGLDSLDRYAGKMRRGESVIIAARPSVGKTSLLAQMILANAKKGLRQVVFPLENRDVTFADQLACHISSLSIRNISNLPTLDQHRFVAAYDIMRGYDLHIFDQPGVTMHEIGTRCRILNAAKKIDAVAVDYLQLVRPADFRVSREQQVAQISRDNKNLARSLDCVSIMLSQLSRKNEDGKRPPVLSDLRESGAIEQDADRVELLDRPEKDKEGIEQDVQAGDERPYVHISINQAKERNGPTTCIWANFRRATTQYLDMVQ